MSCLRVGRHRSKLLAAGLLLLAAGLPAYAGIEEAIAAYKSGDWDTAVKELEPLAQAGMVDAQFYLGYMYETGRGVEPDLEQAARWYRAAAEQGEPKAQFNLGAAYESGRGVPQDAAQAHSWYLKSADEGFERAQYKVAELYASGTGVEQDLIEAHKWFAICGRNRYRDARKRRNRVAKQLDLYEIAEADLRRRVWLEAQQDD